MATWFKDVIYSKRSIEPSPSLTGEWMGWWLLWSAAASHSSSTDVKWCWNWLASSLSIDGFNMVLHIEFNWCRCTGVLIGLSFSYLTARWKINGTADWVLTIRYRFIRITQGYVTVRVRHSSSISISISSNSSSSISGHRALCIRMSISIRTSNQCPTSIRGSIRRSG